MIKIFKKIKPFLPQFLIDFGKKNSGYFGFAIWEYAPLGFSTKIKLGGWDLDSLAVVQSQKWDHYSKRIKSSQNFGVNHENSDLTIHFDPFFHNLLASFAYVISLSGLNKDNINFLDWGGGIGHYGLLAEELIKPASVELNYFCFDFPAFCENGKKLNPSFNYFSNENLHHEMKFDLAMASSSIWYEQDWKNGIDKLCNFDINFLYITRMIFIENLPSYVAIQRPKFMGYNTEYLFWVINKNEFMNYLNEKGFSIIREFEFGDVPPIFKAPEQGTMKGFLFKRN